MVQRQGRGQVGVNGPLGARRRDSPGGVDLWSVVKRGAVDFDFSAGRENNEARGPSTVSLQGAIAAASFISIFIGTLLFALATLP